jgi:hypothetical protein
MLTPRNITPAEECVDLAIGDLEVILTALCKIGERCIENTIDLLENGY